MPRGFHSCQEGKPAAAGSCRPFGNADGIGTDARFNFSFQYSRGQCGQRPCGGHV